MDTDKKSFEWHLGAVIEGLAHPHGGRQFLIDLLPWSKNTVIRRLKGDTEFTVKELEIIAKAVNAEPGDIVAQALRNYSGGDAETGIQMLIVEEGSQTLSEAPANLAEHRAKKTPAEMTEEEMEGVLNAANRDPEIGWDEPEQP